MNILTLDQMSKEELNVQRAFYKDSITRLKRVWNKIGFEGRYRAGKTLLNLHRQIERIDALQEE